MMPLAIVFLSALSALSARATEVAAEATVSGSVQIAKEGFHGWPNTYRLSNGVVEVRVVTDVGPRLISFRRVGGEEMLYARERELGGRNEAEWVFRGGWRLWVSPETKAATYVPDNSACEAEIVDGSLIVTGPPQPAAGIRKQVEIELPAAEPGLRITSRIKNVSDRALTYAAWSLPVLRPGGRALLPLDAGELTAFDAIRRLIFWSYAEIDDPRYRFGNRLVQIDHSQVKPPPPNQAGRRDDESKIGVDSAQGWAAYLLNGTLFLKRFPHDAKGTYPDGGSTVEVYSSSEFLELENLGPLTTIQPGEEIVMPEDWWLFDEAAIPAGEAEALTAIAAYLARTASR
jgi:hypothetical protein